MARRFIDRFRAVVLDMGDTFMFGCDRFSGEDGLAQTWQSLGGGIAAQRVHEIVDALLARMEADARSGECDDAFASVSDQLARLPQARELPALERDRIETLVARHEAGRVPEAHTRVLQELRRSRPLGLISNVWSRAEVFEAELRRARVLELFDVRVWSSEHGCIKPSPTLFERALRELGVAAHEAVFVGDHPQRDVAAAGRLGMATVWVRSRRAFRDGDPRPDRTIESLAELLELD